MYVQSSQFREAIEAYEEAVKQLCRFVDYFRDRPRDTRHREQKPEPSMPIPWNQRHETD